MACARRFTILADGGVRVTWACGATATHRGETAIDVEVLADHLPRHHHHRWHLSPAGAYPLRVTTKMSTAPSTHRPNTQ